MVVVVGGAGVVVVGVGAAAPSACRPALGTRVAPAAGVVLTRGVRTRTGLAGVGVGGRVVDVAVESEDADDDEVSAVAAVIGSSEPGGGVGGSDSTALTTGAVDVAAGVIAAETPAMARTATKMIGMATARWPRPGNFDSPISHRTHWPAAFVHRFIMRPLSRR